MRVKIRRDRLEFWKEKRPRGWKVFYLYYNPVKQLRAYIQTVVHEMFQNKKLTLRK